MRRRDFIKGIAGSAAAWPLAAHAQQAGKTYKIGWLSAGSFERSPAPAAFLDALRELGWIEGKTFAFERRYAENRPERLPELAAELVRLNVDVIVGVALPTLQLGSNYRRFLE